MTEKKDRTNSTEMTNGKEKNDKPGRAESPDKSVKPQHSGKLSFRTKLSYGVGGVADEAMYTLSGTFLMFFLTSAAGIPPSAAGIIVAIGPLWEVICGATVGYLSDHMESRYGKRKPFLMAAAVPVSIVITLLFTAIHASMIIKVIYYAAMTLLFWQSFAMFFVPYMTWGSDLTDDYHERTVLRTYAFLFNKVGMTLGMVLPSVMVDWLMNRGMSLQFSWTALGAVVGVLSGGALLYCALTIHISDRPDFKKDPNRGRLLDPRQLGVMMKEYVRIFELRPIHFIIGASVLYLIGNTFFCADRVYFFTYNMGFSAGTISILMLLITVASVVLAPILTFICGRIDKKNVATVGILVTGILLALGWFIDVDSFMDCCVICLIYSVGNTCYWQLMPSMIYDVCEAEELAYGERHSGQVMSLQALSESMASAIGSVILGIGLQAAGFQESQGVQPASAMEGISDFFTLAPGVCMIAVAFVMARHPINQHSVQRIKDGLDQLHQGITIDLSEYMDIFGKSFVRRRKHSKMHTEEIQ